MQVKMNKLARKAGKYIIKYPAMLLLVAAGSWPGLEVHAQEHPNVNKVPTAVPTLRINPDTRASSLGEAGLATSPDAASGMLNAAKTIFIKEKMGVVFNYTPWLRDISSDSYLLSVAGYQKLDEQQAVTASLRYFTSGKVEERDYNNNLMQLLTPNEFIFDAAYARQLSDNFSASITFRYIHSAIGKTINNTSGAGNAFAADLSAYYTALDEQGEGLTAGLIIGNIGTGKMNYSGSGENDGFLPARIGLGGGYTMVVNPGQKLSFTGEVNKSLVPLMPEGDEGYNEYKSYGVIESYGKGLSNGAAGFSAGAEYMYEELIAIRAGYFGESKAYGGRKYFSAGAGLKYKKTGIDLAYVFPEGNGAGRNALSNTFRLGFSFYPGK